MTAAASGSQQRGAGADVPISMRRPAAAAGNAWDRELRCCAAVGADRLMSSVVLPTAHSLHPHTITYPLAARGVQPGAGGQSPAHHLKLSAAPPRAGGPARRRPRSRAPAASPTSSGVQAREAAVSRTRGGCSSREAATLAPTGLGRQPAPAAAPKGPLGRGGGAVERRRRRGSQIRAQLACCLCPGLPC